jgi:lysophospholipase L1-like esterase
VGNVRLYARLSRGIDPEAQLGTLSAYLFVPGAAQMTIPSDQWINEAGVRVLQRNEASMFTIARQHGIQPVLSTMAVRGPTGNTLSAYMARANDALREVAGRESVPLIDVDAALSNQSELFDSYVHFNDSGELRHAEVVVYKALRLGLFGLR